MNKIKNILITNYDINNRFLVEIENNKSIITFVGYILDYEIINKETNTYSLHVICNQNHSNLSKEILFKRLISLQYNIEDELMLIRTNNATTKKYKEYKKYINLINEFINTINFN